MNFYPTDHAVQRYRERMAQDVSAAEALRLVAQRAEEAYWHGSLRSSATGRIMARHDGLQFVLDDRPDGFAVVTVYFPVQSGDALRGMIRHLQRDSWAAQRRRHREARRR